MSSQIIKLIFGIILVIAGIYLIIYSGADKDELNSIIIPMKGISLGVLGILVIINELNFKSNISVTEEQNQQKYVQDTLKDKSAINKSIEFNYRLFYIGKWIIISSCIYFVVMEFGKIWTIYYYIPYIFCFFIIVGWIIAIPAAITYKRKSKKKYRSMELVDYFYSNNDGYSSIYNLFNCNGWNWRYDVI